MEDPLTVPDATVALVKMEMADPALIMKSLQKAGVCVKTISLDIPFTATPMASHDVLNPDQLALVELDAASADL